MAEKELKVGVGDMKFIRGEGRIITYALGSCIGVAFYDPILQLGALLHILLPEQCNSYDSNVYKYADSGIRETIRKLTAFGMVKSRTMVKIAGGAKMFEISGNADFGNIGQRNAAMVKRVLSEEKMRLVAEDTGGTYARTMLLSMENGDVTIRTFGRPEKHL
ncbi:MAG: chemotaxis protein CheD [Clostridiales bacterium]|nr:chemotaxis protein CheD [Clostridiales bacterium]